MGRWMSAVVVVSLSGCGLGVVVPVERQPDGLPKPGTVVSLGPDAPVLRLQLQPVDRQPPTLTALPAEVHARKVRDAVGVGVNVSNVLGAEGKTLSVVVGEAGCGFSVNATGKAVVANGVAHVTLDSKLPADRELTVMLVLDTDGDGKCSAADALWSTGVVTTQEDFSLAINLASLEPGENWLCFAME